MSNLQNTKVLEKIWEHLTELYTYDEEFRFIIEVESQKRNHYDNMKTLDEIHEEITNSLDELSPYDIEDTKELAYERMDIC